MQRSLRLSLSLSGVAALALSNGALVPASAQEAGSAEDLGVMEINLKDAINFNWGFQGALQGAGTPNQAGIGGFLPLSVGDNSVFFVDALANANFADYGGYSSIGQTTVAGTTISTSTRLGYRWLNGDRSTMYGINAGYDSRPIATGTTTNGIEVFNSQTPFFQQVAVNVELQSNQWGANVYGLIPVGKYGYGSDNIATMNSSFAAEPLTTVGLDVNYNISNLLAVMAGYYYQSCEKEPEIFENYAEGSGVKARLEYDISYQPQAGVAYSYDEILNPG